MVERRDLLQGTLDLLILRTLELQSLHGWGISERIEQMSNHVFKVKPGSLYPALERLRQQGWIEAEWRRTENNRKARYYTLTRAGRNRLQDQKEAWLESSGAINRILGTA